MKLFFLCGLPASGKTTIAKQLEQTEHAIRLTLDERMIAQTDLTIYDDEYGRLVALEKEKMWSEAVAYLQAGRSVILDWSLWSRAARQAWTGRATAAGFVYELIYLNRPVADIRQALERRNQQRSTTVHHIDLAEFDRFCQIFEPPTAAESLNLRIIRPDQPGPAS